MNKQLKKNLTGYLFISPWMLCFFLFTLFPVFMSLYYSLTSFDILSAPRFIGLENYKYLLTGDRKFWMAVKVTLLYAFVSIPLRLVFWRKSIEGREFTEPFFTFLPLWEKVLP